MRSRNGARNAAERRVRAKAGKEKAMPKMNELVGVGRTLKEEPVIANFNFREKGKVQPKGYKAMCIDQEVTVITKGKIRSIGSSWDNGATFSVEVVSCEIEKPETKQVSLGAAMDEAAANRKRVM